MPDPNLYYEYEPGDMATAESLNTMQLKIKQDITDQIAGIQTVPHADSADNATEADHAKQSDNAAEADHAKQSDNAAEADHAKQSDNAAEADHAKQSDNAAEADHAKQSDNAAEADHAKQSDNAAEADHAKQSDNAKTADRAKQADNARNADSAKSADNARNADHAKNADNAKEADHAKSADTAQDADNAKNAEYATAAGSAKTADYAKEAGHALKADWAKDAEKAKEATRALKADWAKDADHAEKADEALTAGSAKTAEFATLANKAKDADNADEAGHAKTADYAENAKYAKEAEHANEAEHAKEAAHALKSEWAKDADNSKEAAHALKSEWAKEAEKAKEAEHALKAEDSEKLDGKTPDELITIIVKKAVDEAIKQTVEKVRGYGYQKIFKKLETGQEKIIVHDLGEMPLVDIYQLDYFPVVTHEDGGEKVTWVNFYMYHSSERRFRKRLENGTLINIEIEGTNGTSFKISFEDMLKFLGVSVKGESSLSDVETEMWKKLNQSPHDNFDDDQYSTSPWFGKCCQERMTVDDIKRRGEWDDIWVQFRPRKTVNLPIPTIDEKGVISGPLAAPVNIEVKQYNLTTISLTLLDDPLYSTEFKMAMGDKGEGRMDLIKNELKVMVLLKV